MAPQHLQGWSEHPWKGKQDPKPFLCHQGQGGEGAALGTIPLARPWAGRLLPSSDGAFNWRGLENPNARQ